MLAVGLTGGIGSGKSTVARLLASRGAAIVDADLIAREVVAPGGAAYAAVVERFGPEVVAPDKSIDRPALAARVFADPEALADLNALTHPAVGALMGARLAKLASGGSPAAETGSPGSPGSPRIAVAVIPLLRPEHVAGLGLKAVVVVDCPTEVAIDRLVGERGMDEGDARARIAAQPSREERRALADYVVDNAGTLADLERRVDALWAWLGDLESSCS